MPYRSEANSLERVQRGSRLESMKRAAWFDSLLLFFLTVVLIWPLFRLKYLDNWPSIESTFIADARMLGNHLPHPGWQPLWYCGTRFDYIYPPALRYGTAILAKFGGLTTARAYHLYAAIFYVFGIVAVYWLVRVGSGSRWGALVASCGVALLSPSFLALPPHRQDSDFWVPQRLHALMSYGEGPHISALCVLPAALALSFLALRKGTSLALAGSAVLCALIVATNFYGATALAIFFPIATWAVWVTQPDRSVWLRALGIVALGYALSAFWLTPSYLRITEANLSLVSQPGSNWSRITALLVVAVFGGITWRWGNRRPERAWTVFVWGAGLFFGLYVLGLHYLGFRVAGEGFRLIPELDLALILVLVELVRTLWKYPRLRPLAVLVLLTAFSPAVRYLRHSRSPFPKSGPVENRYEYLIAKWTHDHLPGERVLPSGTVRFWFNAWFDNPQLDGGSNQGMLNQILPAAGWQIMTGGKGEIAVLWLQALGTDAVIVPDRTSLEWYHDYQKPEKFRGLAPVLYDDRHGTVIYRIPRLYPGIGRVVETAKIAAVGQVQSGDDVNTLARYVAVVDNAGQSPTSVEWKSFDEAEVQAQLVRGQSVLVQETYDPAWHAYIDGRALPIHLERVMNFMLIEAPEGSHKIQLRFETPLENRIGQCISVLGLVVAAALVIRGSRPTSGNYSQ